jgi:hypothetical protein
VHLRDHDIEALAGGAMPGASGEAARRHVLECAACARQLERWREDEEHTARLLTLIDHPAPPVSVDALIARARQHRARWRVPIAAGIAAALIAGAAAAAVPGSPVRRYVERVLTAVRPGAPRRTPIDRRAPEPGAVSGIAFVPARSVDVTFREVQSAGSIRITVGDSPTLRVTHAGGTAGYELTDDGVVIDNAHSGASYQVSVPQSAPLVRVRAGDHVVFTKQGARITAAVAPDRGGAYVIAFAQLGRRSS